MATDFFRIQLGQINEWDSAQSVGYLQSILSFIGDGTIRFMIFAQASGITYAVWFIDNPISADNFRSITLRYYPNAVVDSLPLRENSILPIYERVTIFQRRATQEFFETLVSIEQTKNLDPLAQLVRTMSGLYENESIMFTLVVHSPTQYTTNEIRQFLTQTKAEAGVRSPRFYQARTRGDQFFDDLRRAFLRHFERVEKFSESDRKRHFAKLSQPIYETIISVQFQSPQEGRLDAFAPVYSSIMQFSTQNYPVIEAGYSKSKRVNKTSELLIPEFIVWNGFKQKNVHRYLYWESHIFYLSPSELTALWHLPHTGFNIVSTGNRQVKAPNAVLSNKQGVLIGENIYAGNKYPIFLPMREREAHTAMLGKTRVGKSSLMHRMIHEDIKQGLGVCVVDPHADLVRDILQHSIPAKRENDVVVLDILTTIDREFYPPPLNMPLNFRFGNEQIATRKLKDTFMLLFKSMKMKRMASTLTMALDALEAESHPTLLDIRRFFLDADYRNKLSQNVSNFTLRQKIQEFNNKNKGQQDADAYPIHWRLESFYDNPYLRAMTCHPKPLNISDMVAENKIILVSLGGDTVYTDDDRFVLGTSIIQQIQLAALSGSITKRPYMLYVDEFQKFIDTPVPEMLSQIGKRGLALVLANQYFKQLGDVQDAIDGTVGTYISFEIGDKDARAFAPHFRGFKPDDFTALGEYSAIVSTRTNKNRQPAFTIDTLPPPGFEKSDSNREFYLRRLSVDNLGLESYGVIDKWLERRYTGVDLYVDTDEPPEEGFQNTYFE